MIPRVGIDLGTTFSCMSYIDEQGIPVIIKNSDGQDTTPSVIWFDGKVAYVGKKANDRKLQANSPVYEFVKRDIGKSVSNRYVIDGFDYGAVGMSAIILRKLKYDAFYFFKRKAWLSPDDTLQNLVIPAVITVPAYFRDKQRHETRLAGIAAGFDVIAIVNEPTAAALTYGFDLNETKRIMVFDLGGGTFDASILEIAKGNAKVIASDGADQLGGKDWDKIIKDYLLAEFERQTGKEVPDDLCWDIDRHANESKINLTEQPEINVLLNAEGNVAELTLYRERPAGSGDVLTDFILDDENEDGGFYFEERAQDLLAICKAIMNNMLDKAGFTWNDIDDIVLAGGSSRMPMISKMLEQVSRKKIRRSISGYSFDTAISQGAAIYGRNRERVIDVTSKSVGIEMRQSGKMIIEHLIKKNMPLPVSITETFPAERNTTLKIYEGEDSTDPEHCYPRGKLQLENPAGKVVVGLTIDAFGIIHASIDSNGTKAELRIQSEEGEIDIVELKSKIEAIDLRA
ncbi:Hsp70 family protein [Dyadobacter sp. LJ53]|uniref:Hsp70 family protein n=1 Tax=Dyadobacter chenwenxiniae TaxID=2906456 RepID=UPI001F167E35|nr:Hsp70 family protein [Dyadobacter chenwenxiniae]MCF0051610.1 Hsp70 family protein [Dyadobacter chenwenxiniae]